MGRKKKKNRNKSARGGQKQLTHKNQKRSKKSLKTRKSQLPSTLSAQAVLVHPATPPVQSPESETTFSKKLEEVISQSEGKKQLLGGKLILLGAPANMLFRRWQTFRARFFSGLKKIGVITLGLLLVAALLIGVEVYANNHVFPRISLAGQSMSLMEIGQARSEVMGAVEQYANGSISFTYGEHNAAIPLSDLGIQMDPTATMERLPYFQLRRNGVWDLLMATIFGMDIKPVFQKDDQLIFETVQSKLGLDAERAKNAQFTINDKKELAIVPEQAGRVIDQKLLQSAIIAHLNTLNTDPVEIITLEELPEVTAPDLEKTRDDLQLKLENQITIKHGDQSWQFKPLDHVGEIAFRKPNDQTIIAIPDTLLNGYFQEEIFSKVETPVSHLKIYYDDQEKIIFEGKAINGEIVNREKFVNDLEMAINSLDPEIELQMDTELAQLEIDEKLQEQGIRELIGTGHTAFAGSPSNRRHNIATGMSKFQGLIIKPGETFSFNDNLGEVDGSTGYKLELVIKAEGTVPEYGGGICQVSSTMFKAALFSGLPVVERSPHSYAVSYYAQIDGYGLDSTIYPGVKDLKFTNDTPGNILIQTVVDGDDAYINFFGTGDGRQVALTNYWRGNYRGAGGTVMIPTTTLPPGAKKQIEAAHGGFDASWDRIITKDGKETVEKIYSVYRATSNRILVGQETEA